MQFESRVRRTYWTNAFLSLIPDIAISGLISWLMDGGALGGIAAFVAIQVLYLIIWLKTLGWSWLMFNLSGRANQARALLEMLRRSGMPEPSDYESSAEGYLASVATNDGLPAEMRLSAAESLGGLKILPILGRLSLAIQMSISFEDAVQAYKADFQRHNLRRHHL